MPEHGVLILECFDKADPGSEGLFLAHMFNLMHVDHQYVEVRTKRQFLSLLTSSPYELIHITTHGSVRRCESTDNFLGLWLRDGKITIRDLRRLKDKLQAYTIVSTACLSGDDSFAEAFVQTTGCDYYVAPSGSPTFHNAIFFAHIFYHKYFILKRSVSDILARYDEKYRNPHKFAVVPFKEYIDSALE